MKKFVVALGLAAVILPGLPPAAQAEQTPVRISASYNTDSDGVSFTNYSLTTERKNNPWNYMYTNTRIRQRDSEGNVITENRFTVNWRQPIDEESSFSVWAGYANSNVWKFAAFGAQYHGVVNYTDQLRLSYEHDAVPTVAAYNAHILGDRLSWSYQHEIDRRLTLDLALKYARFSDSNFRKTVTVALTKTFSPRYRLGLEYGYDTSDLNKKSVFYLPKGEHSLSLVPEIALPVGGGILVMTMSKSLFSRNVNGNINRTTYGARYRLKNLEIGMQYYRDDNYWSRDYSFSWNNRW
ncbi:MAG TPA: hypothetical protein VN611_03305 [Patescibacteria group bacterium]|nr:hypothetical protein [Patescibacteria group bacterium]